MIASAYGGGDLATCNSCGTVRALGVAERVSHLRASLLCRDDASEGGTKGCDAGPSAGILGNGLNGSFGVPVPGLGR